MKSQFMKKKKRKEKEAILPCNKQFACRELSKTAFKHETLY